MFTNCLLLLIDDVASKFSLTTKCALELRFNLMIFLSTFRPLSRSISDYIDPTFIEIESSSVTIELNKMEFHMTHK